MRQRDTHAPQSAAGLQVVSRQGCKDGQGANLPGRVLRNVAERLSSNRNKIVARLCVAAMFGAIDQRPDGSGTCGIPSLAAKQPGSDPEQQSSTALQALGNVIAPRERLE